MSIDNRPLVLKDLTLRIALTLNDYGDQKDNILNKSQDTGESTLLLHITESSEIVKAQVTKAFYYTGNATYQTRLAQAQLTGFDPALTNQIEYARDENCSKRHDLALEDNLTNLFDTILQEGRPVAKFRSLLNFNFSHKKELNGTVDPISYRNIPNEFRYLIDKKETITTSNASFKPKDESAIEKLKNRREQIYRYFYPRFRESVFTTKEEFATEPKDKKTKRIREYRYPVYAPPSQSSQSRSEAQETQQRFLFSLYTKNIVTDSIDLRRPADVVSHTYANSQNAKAQHNECIVAEIASLRLLNLYENHLLTIEYKPAIEDEALSLMPELSSSPEDDGVYLGWWRVLFNAFDKNKPMARQYLFEVQTCRWLAFNNLARNLYPSFIEQSDENKIAWSALYQETQQPNNASSTITPILLVDHTCTERTNEWVQRKKNTDEIVDSQFPEFKIKATPIVTTLASYFFSSAHQAGSATNAKERIELHKPLDPRMHIMSNIGLSGDYPKSHGGVLTNKNTFDLAKYIDKFDDRVGPFTTMYNRDFMDELATSQDYLRWKDITYLASFNEFACVNVSYGWFANNVMYWHWTEMYAYLSNYCLLVINVLHKTAEEIQQNTKKLLDDEEEHTNKPDKSHQLAPGEEFRRQRQDFIELMNRFWFTSASAEQQPTEIFNKLKQSLGLQNAFDEVREKIDWADEFMESRREKYAQDYSKRLTLIALGFAGITLFLDLNWNFWTELPKLFQATNLCLSNGEIACGFNPMVANFLFKLGIFFCIGFGVYKYIKPSAKKIGKQKLANKKE
ncbi:hypothetical protein [Paraglaciecola sp. 20A4]|uniref:hypothetical protein n=1 Tax=Paraglaciecola sp. 20A4 TaxID=2687288 RepID=UPI00140B1D55|nr:hypothetical protein [Paraglaciecola sp. 20A4]